VIRVRPESVECVSLEGPATLTYRGATVKAAGPGKRVIPVADIAKRPVIELAAAPPTFVPQPLPKGCRISGDVTCAVALETGRIVGKSSGRGGFLYAPMPPGLNVLPELVIDSQTYAPGTTGDTLIIPLMPGEHAFEVRALPQPRVFRNWQAW
jgi:hypothetical protein